MGNREITKRRFKLYTYVSKNSLCPRMFYISCANIVLRGILSKPRMATNEIPIIMHQSNKMFGAFRYKCVKIEEEQVLTLTDMLCTHFHHFYYLRYGR